MIKLLKHLRRSESGAAGAEYALLLAIVAAGIAIAAFNLGESVDTAVTNADACVDAVGAGTSPATVAGCGTSTSTAGGAAP